MSVTNEDSNDSQQRKALDARQSEATLYVTFQLHLSTMHMYTGSSGSTAAGMIGPTRYWRRLRSPPWSNASSNGTTLKRSKQL